MATLPFAYIIHITFGWCGLAIAGALAFFIGCIATDHYLRKDATSSDPKEVVIDEVAGQLLALAFVAPTFTGYVVGFLLFRAFDIIKPGPIGWADRELKGAMGVMFDDVLAGLAAAFLPIIALLICVEFTELAPLANWLNSFVSLYVP